MGHLTNAVCFTCGLVIESPPKLSRLTNGQACPACRERVLEDLPPALPSRAGANAHESELDPEASEATTREEHHSPFHPDGWDEAS